jgi:hypothetical protein
VSALDKYPMPLRARIMSTWKDDDVGREDFRRRFDMAESEFQRLVAELGPRPKLTFAQPTRAARAARKYKFR